MFSRLRQVPNLCQFFKFALSVSAFLFLSMYLLGIISTTPRTLITENVVGDKRIGSVNNNHQADHVHVVGDQILTHNSASLESDKKENNPTNDKGRSLLQQSSEHGESRDTVKTVTGVQSNPVVEEQHSLKNDASSSEAKDNFVDSSVGEIVSDKNEQPKDVLDEHVADKQLVKNDTTSEIQAESSSRNTSVTRATDRVICKCTKLKFILFVKVFTEQVFICFSLSCTFLLVHMVYLP